MDESIYISLLAEFLGTYFLLTVINMVDPTPIGAMSACLALFIVIIVFGHMSGGHFNPAITFMKLLDGGAAHITVGVAAAYIAAQVLGGVCALYGLKFVKSIV
jgi:aquaporin Z